MAPSDGGSALGGGNKGTGKLAGRVVVLGCAQHHPKLVGAVEELLEAAAVLAGIAAVLDGLLLQGAEHGSGGAAGVDGGVAVALAVGGDALELFDGCAAELGVAAAGAGEVRPDAGARGRPDRGEIEDAGDEFARKYP